MKYIVTLAGTKHLAEGLEYFLQEHFAIIEDGQRMPGIRQSKWIGKGDDYRVWEIHNQSAKQDTDFFERLAAQYHTAIGVIDGKTGHLVDAETKIREMVPKLIQQKEDYIAKYGTKYRMASRAVTGLHGGYTSSSYEPDRTNS